ncbi:MAG TPA: amino acid adenylation domain-containing protein, partial [Phytomonospora sp.]
MTAVSAFLDGVREHPERTALIWRDRSRTYAELAGEAASVARRLVADGVPRGAAVGILGERGTHVIAGILGAMLAGCHFVPLDLGSPPARIGRIVADSGMAALLTYGDRAAETVSALGDVLSATAVHDLADFRDAAWGIEEFAERLPSPADPAYCIYTSGTTGTPKGVLLVHRGVANLRAHLRAAYGVTSADRVLQFSNLTFDASVWEIALSLLNGAGLVIVDQDTVHDTRLLARECHRTGVTLGLLPPQYYLLCDDLPFRIVTTGGAASSHAVVKKARVENTPYINAYGPTETTVLATGWHDTGEPLGHTARVPIGIPVANTQVHILDGERLCGIGEVGELCVTGDGLSTGYIGLPELTARHFEASPYGRLYRTGDRARRLDDGTIEYLGRLDDQQVKIRGHRIELGEVEAAIREHPAVRDAAVVATGPDDSTALAAYVVSTDGGEPDGLRGFLAERVPGYMVPAYITAVPAIPLNRSGKLDRAALPAPALDASEGVDAASEAEQAVCEAFADVLGLDAVGATDSFFELGGDSIKAIRAVSRIRAAGYEVSVGAVMAGMTARGVTARLGRAAHDGEQGEVTGPVAGRTPIADAFFAWDLAVPAHFNQDALIDVGTATVEEVRAALDAVWAHHDMLRAVVTGRRLVIRPSTVSRYGFAHVATDAFDAEVARAHEAMDLNDGPLFHAVLATDPGGGRRLLLVAHHLVVDAVSWQIITEDVRAGIANTALPAKTASTKAWAAALETLAETLVPEESAHWDAVEAAAREAALPTHPGPVTSDVRVAALDHERTTAVLAAGAAYHAGTEDVLLAALA